MHVNSNLKCISTTIYELSQQKNRLDHDRQFLENIAKTLTSLLHQQKSNKTEHEIILFNKQEEINNLQYEIERITRIQEFAEKQLLQLAEETKKLSESNNNDYKYDRIIKLTSQAETYPKELNQIEIKKSQIINKDDILFSEKEKASLAILSAESKISDLSKDLKYLEEKLRITALQIKEITAQKYAETEADVCILAGNQEEGCLLSLFPKEVVLKILMIKANTLG